jgi:hypothetical protein
MPFELEGAAAVSAIQLAAGHQHWRSPWKGDLAAVGVAGER